MSLLPGYLTVVTFCSFELIEDPVGLPPPMMLRLSELCFSVMTVKVRPIGIHTLQSFGPEKKSLSWSADLVKNQLDHN